MQWSTRLAFNEQLESQASLIQHPPIVSVPLLHGGIDNPVFEYILSETEFVRGNYQRCCLVMSSSGVRVSLIWTEDNRLSDSLFLWNLCGQRGWIVPNSSSLNHPIMFVSLLHSCIDNALFQYLLRRNLCGQQSAWLSCNEQFRDWSSR